MTEYEKCLEHQSRTLRLLVTTVAEVSPVLPTRDIAGETYPSSKCLHRFSASCSLVLQLTHSNLNTTFFVVLAFLWNTGFV